MQQLHLDAAHRHPVAGLVGLDVAAVQARDLDDPGGLQPVGVYRAGVDRHQGGEPFDGHAEDVAAYMIRVVVRDQRAGDAHAVRRGGVDDALDVPGGVHHQALTGVAVTDEVHEVLHLPGEGVCLTDVAPAEELPEIERGHGRSSNTPRHRSERCLTLT